MREITVAALNDFWTVRCDGVRNEMLFPTGGQAEDAARRLADSLSAAGEPSLLCVFDRKGAPVGRFLCTSPAARALSAAARGRESGRSPP